MPCFFLWHHGNGLFNGRIIFRANPAQTEKTLFKNSYGCFVEMVNVLSKQIHDKKSVP
jgi:hypothetical protein